MKEEATIYDRWKMCKYYDGVCKKCPLKKYDCSFGASSTHKEVDILNDLIIAWKNKQKEFEDDE